MTDFAVVNVERGKRYRLRLLAMSCHSMFAFSIDNHNLTIIEADGELTEPLLVDSINILAGQRYSVILDANQPVDNYWLRALPNFRDASFAGGRNLAILRYNGAPVADPTTTETNTTMPFLEPNLHALINPGAPGIPEYGMADINLLMNVYPTDYSQYLINGVQFKPPTVPVLLQIMSGAQQATDLLPAGTVYVLESNKVVELTMTIGTNTLTGPTSLTRPVSFNRIETPCYTYLMISR